MKCRFVCSLALLAALSCASADAALVGFLDTPQRTGVGEWDVFSTIPNAAGPHTPDQGATNFLGSISLTAAAPSMIGGGPIVTGTFNLYAGHDAAAGLRTYAFTLNPTRATQPNTTVVLQLGYSPGALSDFNHTSLQLNGMAPTDVVNRGLISGVSYYWAEWSGLAAATNYSLSYTTGPHHSLQGAQVEYINSAQPVNVPNPAPVPEPASAAIAGLGLVASLAFRKWKR